MSEPVLYGVADGVGRITLNRPGASNAVDLSTAQALAEAVARAAADDGVRVLLLCGNGRRFCAGGDLASMAQAAQRQAYVRTLAATLDGALRAMASLPKPVVVAVQGAAVGAGLAAVLSADIAIAARSTTFAAAYTAPSVSPRTAASPGCYRGRSGRRGRCS